MVINTLLKKYFLKPLYYIFIFLVIFTFYELTNINFKYINKDLITIDINNIRNPQIKKIARYLDNNFAFYYFKFSEKKQKSFFIIIIMSMKLYRTKRLYQVKKKI